MIERAKELLTLNKYDPRVKITLDYEMDKLLAIGTEESKEVYNELLKFRAPTINPKYGNLFSDFASTDMLYVDKLVRRYSLDLIIGVTSFAQDLAKFCNDSVTKGYIGYNQPYCKQQIMACAGKFLQEHKANKDDKWLWFRWLEVITVRALRRNTVYKVDIENVISVIKTINNYRRNIITSYFKDDLVEQEYHMLDIEMQEKFFEGRQALDEYEEQKRQRYLYWEDETYHGRTNRDKLLNKLINLVEMYTGKPTCSAGSFYIEYVETQVTEVPATLLFYHTPEEALDCFTECSVFLRVFENKSLKDSLIDALMNEGECAYRRYEDVSFDDYARNNLKLLASKGILSPQEYFEYMQKLKLV